MNVTAHQLRTWKASSKRYQVIAAAIAEWACEQERGTALPGNYVFTRNLDFEPSIGTIQRAKRFLADQGVLEIAYGPYYVA
jgi:hypothetical protein